MWLAYLNFTSLTCSINHGAMDSPNGAQTPQTPPAEGRHTSYSSDGSTVCGTDYEKGDLESNSIRPIDRSISHYLGAALPISANLCDIEEDLAESEDGELADVNAIDYQKSGLTKYTHLV